MKGDGLSLPLGPRNAADVAAAACSNNEATVVATVAGRAAAAAAAAAVRLTHSVVFLGQQQQQQQQQQEEQQRQRARYNKIALRADELSLMLQQKRNKVAAEKNTFCCSCIHTSCRSPSRGGRGPFSVAGGAP